MIIEIKSFILYFINMLKVSEKLSRLKILLLVIETIINQDYNYLFLFFTTLFC